MEWYVYEPRGNDGCTGWWACKELKECLWRTELFTLSFIRGHIRENHGKVVSRYFRETGKVVNMSCRR